MTAPVSVCCPTPAPGASPVEEPGSVSFAMPKSSTFAYPSGLSMMFSGLMSRWTMPAACAADESLGDLRGDVQRLAGPGPRAGNRDFAASAPSTNSVAM